MPTPGKLFMVGDPKQSIYRFRRADIETVAQACATTWFARARRLQQNFRSQQSIISWVNHVFGRWMRNDKSSDLQAEYRYLIATPSLPNEGPAPPPAVYYVGQSVSGNAEYARRLEGQAVAVLSRRIKEERWQVRSQKTRRVAGRHLPGHLPPAAKPHEPGGAGAGRLKLWTCRIASKASPSCLGTEDVTQLLNCLRAIDSPGDQVALVAALRSAAFSCSDVELLQFVDDGGRFDCPAPRQCHGPSGRSLGRSARVQQ